MRAFSIENSAFKKVLKEEENIFAQTEMHLININSLKKSFIFHEHRSTSDHPPLIKYLADILLTLIKSSKGEDRD